MAKRGWGSAVLGMVCGSLAAVLLFAGMAQAKPRDDAREEFHHTYPLAANGRVDVSTVSGNIKITAWDSNEVKVDAVKHASKPEQLNDVSIDVSAFENTIRIRTKYHKNGTSNADVDYELMVPRNARLEDIDVTSGSISITGVAGRIHASSVSGNVRAMEVSGSLELSTVSGSVEAELRTAGDSIRLSSVSGSVTLRAPSSLDADITGDTVSGSVHNDFGLPVHRDGFSGEDMEGRVGSGKAHINLSTVSGSVRLRKVG